MIYHQVFVSNNSIINLLRTIESGDNILSRFFTSIVDGTAGFIKSIDIALGGQQISQFFEDLKVGAISVDDLNNKLEVR